MCRPTCPSIPLGAIWDQVFLSCGGGGFPGIGTSSVSSRECVDARNQLQATTSAVACICFRSLGSYLRWSSSVMSISTSPSGKSLLSWQQHRLRQSNDRRIQSNRRDDTLSIVLPSGTSASDVRAQHAQEHTVTETLRCEIKYSSRIPGTKEDVRI